MTISPEEDGPGDGLVEGELDPAEKPEARDATCVGRMDTRIRESEASELHPNVPRERVDCGKPLRVSRDDVGRHGAPFAPAAEERVRFNIQARRAEAETPTRTREQLGETVERVLELAEVRELALAGRAALYPMGSHYEEAPRLRVEREGQMRTVLASTGLAIRSMAAEESWKFRAGA
jgi:hypothetical protein